MEKPINNLKQEFEREPSAEEIAQALEMDVDEISDTMKIYGKQVSVDAPFFLGDENSLLDVIQNEEMPAPDTELISESLKTEIQNVLAILPVREAEVIKLYFGLDGETPLTLEEIGDKFHLTRERVRQIKEKAIRRLRHNSRSKILKSYLG